MENSWTPVYRKTCSFIFWSLTVGFSGFLAHWTMQPSVVKPAAVSQSEAKSCMVATNYYIPEAKNFSCKKSEKVLVVSPDGHLSEICPEAEREARMQGSIQVLLKGELYQQRYTGHIEKLPKTCKTATGAAGVCLIPFVHIAADPSHYNMGDVIAVPALKGKMVPHPSGRGLMKHPGYFIVADTGGRIRGNNRFDFFIGRMAWDSPSNPFGPAGFRMTDASRCILGFNKLDRTAKSTVKLKKQIYALASKVPTADVASLDF